MKNLTKRTKFILITIAIIVALIAVAITAFSISASQNQRSNNTVQPDFEALLPSQVTVDELGGWQKLTPPSGDAIYVFIDTIDSTLINVSQQSLPDSFTGNVNAKVAEMAEAYNATTPLDVTGMTAYIGTSANGPQSVIFAKNDILVLIKSEAKVQDSSWTSYIASLQ
jgi:hypothetical protein